MESHKYDDILYLPHHRSTRHPPMSMQDRAAQFSPFAALSGYEDAVTETARLTDRRRELSEDDKALLDDRLALLTDYLGGLEKGGDRPVAKICYFTADEKKTGGAYQTVTAEVKRVDPVERQLVLKDGRAIPLNDVCLIDGQIFRNS